MARYFKHNSVRLPEDSVTAKRKAYDPFSNFNNETADIKSKIGHKKSQNGAWIDNYHDDEPDLDKKSKRLLMAVIFVAVLTCIFAICALGSPYWTYHGPSNATYPFETSEGLLMACAYPYSSNITCGWIYFSNKPSWVISAAAVWLAGLLFYFLCAMLSCCMCTDTGRNNTFTAVVAAMSIIPACLFLTTVSIWGALSEGLLQSSGVHHYEWGFYLAVTVFGLSVITSILLFVTLCAIRNLKTDYLQNNGK